MKEKIASMIDHTLLKPEATKEQIKQLVTEAKQYRFASVCIQPTWVKFAKEMLSDNAHVQVCTVIGFPLGASTSAVKAYETLKAIEDGATEVDMVINIGALKSGDLELVEADIRSVVTAAKGKALTKVIIETSLLSDEEKRIACELAVKARADFVKTSTGFSTGGATIDDVTFMCSVVGENVGVKASGGIRDLASAKEMIEAGATRLGTSAGVPIMEGLTSSTEGY
ncbi:MAG TPA: deoxyribose-phosphate aldolase [Bacilli bacterium]|nr:deoxyribose-phosphate aldolase [Bacilli bacterium]